MKKKIVLTIVFILIVLGVILFIINRESIFLLINNGNNIGNNILNKENLIIDNEERSKNNSNNFVEESNIEKDDFQIDLVLHADNRDIHYSAYIPDNINQDTAIPLYITLPGYEGLYFQGVGANLQYEDFALVAKEINPNMIIKCIKKKDLVKRR